MTAIGYLWEEAYSLPYGWDDIVGKYLSCAEEYTRAEIVDETGAAILAAAAKLYFNTLETALGDRLVAEFDRFNHWLVPSNTPDELTVWRGGFVNGLSWTRSYKIAKHFAEYRNKHFCAPNFIQKRNVRKCDILMILPDDIELEVLVRPSALLITDPSIKGSVR